MWIVHVEVTKQEDKKTGRLIPRRSIELRHTDAGERCFHVLRGPNAEELIQAIADELNRQGKPVPKRVKKTVSDGAKLPTANNSLLF